MSERKQINLDSLNMPRLAHTYLLKTKGDNFTNDDINQVLGFLAHFMDEKNQALPSYKVGVLMACINEPYWPYLPPIITDVRNQFLFGHEVEIMVWSDVPEEKMKELNVTHFPTDSATWPLPTLMRYNLFLNEEEYLKKFDYLFYIDIDMRMVNTVGDEILGDGLTAARHPMYALSRRFHSPYEADPTSAAYVKQSGDITVEGGKPVFDPLYAAGGFQGGKTVAFIQAMKVIKKGIDDDFSRNYIARWNDESHWNKYLYDNPPAVTLGPNYVYPDSLIKEYYEPIWGRAYIPRIITLTKPFTLSKEGGEAVAGALEQMRRL